MDRITFDARWVPRMLSIMRIIVAFLFMENGGIKLFNIPRIPHPPPHLPPLMLVAGVLEFFGGLLVLMGAFTRPVSFILSGEMAVAYFMANAPHGFWPVLNGGETGVLYCFVFLYLAAAGGGAWSVDRMWHSTTRGSTS